MALMSSVLGVGYSYVAAFNNDEVADSITIPQSGAELQGPEYAASEVNNNGRDLVWAGDNTHRVSTSVIDNPSGDRAQFEGDAQGTPGQLFEAPQSLAFGSDPLDVTTGDFDGDGTIDLATSNVADDVSILLGQGDGTFADAQQFEVGSGPICIMTGDFNGDGFVDLVTANYFSDDVSVLLGVGDGTFQDEQRFGVGNARSVTTGDFNGDGFTDLATANHDYYNASLDGVSVLLGVGDGTFWPEQRFAVGRCAWSITSGDFNGDDLADLATADRDIKPFFSSVSVLLAEGDGTFASALYNDAGESPTSITTGDFNCDGLTDLATANLYSYFGAVSVLFGQGDGTFAPEQLIGDGTASTSVTTADFNGDGITDLCANSYFDNVLVLLGLGDGTFAPQLDVPTGDWPYSVTTGDVNGDGFEDIVTANANSDDLTLLFNTGQQIGFVLSPDSVEVTRGQLVSGSIDDLVSSDDSRLKARRNISDVQSRVVLEIGGTSPTENPSQLTFKLEANVLAKLTVIQSIDFFNYVTDEFEEVDSRPAIRLVEVDTVVEPSGDLSRFVEPGTNRVSARIRLESPIPRQRFSVNIDHTVWRFN